jgi:catechol 2,3-dioxygenase-like lactoylglutathione lyase family enzyme
MYERGFTSRPELPQMPEFEELRRAEVGGVDLGGGHRIEEQRQIAHNVGGVMLARPFKITKIGPVRLWARDMEREVDCYTRLFGLRITEEVTWNGHRCVFLRANSEHHSMALYPEALREALGLYPNSSCFSMGFRLGSYQQLRDAVEFLKGEGVTIKYLPSELLPGMDYTAFAIDPQGHAVQLYSYMEQVGWDGRPRPVEQRRKVSAGEAWPDAIDALDDDGDGEIFLGPLG